VVGAVGDGGHLGRAEAPVGQLDPVQLREPHEVLQVDQGGSLGGGQATAQADDLRGRGADAAREVDPPHTLQNLRVNLPRGRVFGERRSARQKLVN